MPYDYMIDVENLRKTGIAYMSMLSYAKEMLLKRSAEEIAEKANVVFDSERSVFCVPSLGQKIIVSYPDCEVSFQGSDKSPIVFWSLAILHYLSFADGTPLSKDFITFRMLEDGIVRGGNFDRDCSRILGSVFGREPIEAVKEACASLGGEFTDSNADLSMIFPFLPNYPVMVKIWFADDEMDGSGQMLLDSSANRYLSLEDSVSVGSLLLKFLEHQYRS